MLLLYFAWSSLRDWKNYQEIEIEEPQSGPKTILQAVLVNLLNPNSYLGWSLVLGPAVLAAWDEGPRFAALLIFSFYFTMISISMVLIMLMGKAMLLRSEARRSLLLISALLLAGLGIYFISLSGWNLAGKFLSEATNHLYLSIPLRF